MSLADSLKPLARSIRGIPGLLGIRPHTVSILLREWGGTYSGEGNRTDVAVPITEGSGQPPKVRWLKDDEIAVGGLAVGTVEVGPITSEHLNGGITLAQLQAESLAVGGTRYLVITGPQHPSGAKYRVTNFSADRAFHYMIRAEPVDQDS